MSVVTGNAMGSWGEIKSNYFTSFITELHPLNSAIKYKKLVVDVKYLLEVIAVEQWFVHLVRVQKVFQELTRIKFLIVEFLCLYLKTNSQKQIILTLLHCCCIYLFYKNVMFLWSV
jgi:hypothetical protein